MASLNGYDQNAQPEAPLEPMPAGTYMAMIVNSERKENKNRTGEYLLLEFQICDGKHKGRRIKEFLNLWHQNETASQIANSRFAAIREAVGILQPNDSCDLHNVPLEIIVGVTNPDEQGRMFNDIKGFQKRGVSQRPMQQQQQAVAPGWMGQQQ